MLVVGSTGAGAAGERRRGVSRCGDAPEWGEEPT